MTARILPCTLTDQELTVKGGELATKVSDLDDLRKDKADYMGTWNKRVKKIEKEILGLARVISRQSEDREVEVVDMPN